MAAIYTVKQVADILGYSTNSIYSFLKEKRIKGVRVGKGRFRIPEEELARILHLSKKPQEEDVGMVSKPSISEPTIHPKRSLHIPNIFHWFLGSVSILLAESMFLYNIYSDSVLSIHFIPILFPIQAMLFAGGVGLLVSDIVDTKNNSWRRVFQILLACSYGGLVYMGFHIGDGGAMALFGSLMLFTLFVTVFPYRGILTFTIFVCVEIIIISVVFLLQPSMIILPSFVSRLKLDGPYLGVIWLMGDVVYAGIVLWCWKQKRLLYWILMTGTGVLFVIAAGWYAHQVYWAKSVFVLMIGLTSFFIPSWDMLKTIRGDHTKLILSVYTGTLVFLCCLLGIIGIMQRSLFSYTAKNVANTLQFGKSVVDTNFLSVTTTLNGLAQNPAFLHSVTASNTEEVISTLRGAYEGNRLFRRLLVLSKNGDLLSLYPYTELSEKNFSYRDYFIQAAATKSIYFSDVFSSTDKTKINVLVVSIPIMDKGVVQGVLVGSIDLLRIDQQLQGVVKESDLEYFVVTDKNLRYLIHPDQTRIGQLIADTDFLHRATGDDMYQEETFDERGTRILVAGMENMTYGWRLGLIMPVQSVLRMAINTSLMVFYATVIVLVSVLMGITIREWKRYRHDAGVFHDGL